MRISFTLLIFIISFSFYAQSQTTYSDTLKKYSYYLMGMNFNDTINPISCFGQGTGFFINQTKFITAKHVLLNCNYYGESHGCRPDTIMMFYNDTDQVRIAKTWRFDLTHLRTTQSCLPGYKSPDTLSIPKKDTNSIFSIESLISHKTLPKIGEIVMFGFPVVSNISTGQYTLRQHSKLSSKSFSLDSSFSVSGKSVRFAIDSFNYRLTLYDYTVTDELGGFSGSPVFYFDIDDRKWYLLGLLSASNSGTNSLFVVKSRFITNQ